ncbi:unnamed protein product [Protopolystoma xenopodis]|uniref:Uncharacterized protein n=1 Tax=Protopolystoma xenopodis TaxID=117903 RepID=A0A448XIN2_9PLAT|nr:unnamed protein product [Protopolystoma xenopodis]
MLVRRPVGCCLCLCFFKARSSWRDSVRNDDDLICSAAPNGTSSRARPNQRRTSARCQSSASARDSFSARQLFCLTRFQLFLSTVFDF